MHSNNIRGVWSAEAQPPCAMFGTSTAQVYRRREGLQKKTNICATHDQEPDLHRYISAAAPERQHQMQDRATLDVVVLCSLVIVHLLTCTHT